jgi:hypothetical protein
MHPFHMLIQFQGVSFLLLNFPSFLFNHFRSFFYINHFDNKYSSSPRVGIVDVAATSFFYVFLFGIFSLGLVELMYLEQIELM